MAQESESSVILESEKCSFISSDEKEFEPFINTDIYCTMDKKDIKSYETPNGDDSEHIDMAHHPNKFLELADYLRLYMRQNNPNAVPIKTLIVKNGCGIDQGFFQYMNLSALSELYCGLNNVEISNVSFMKSLKILDICGDVCTIRQNGIRELDLYELYCSDNSDIYDVSFMKNLQILDISNGCGVGQEGILNLRLKELQCDNNTKITDVSFMITLERLNAGNNCGIDNNGIKGLNLLVLHCRNNAKITDVSFMTRLQGLDASGTCGIDDNGIKNLKLTGLNHSDNPKITDVGVMSAGFIIKRLKIEDS
jgi:hypothetical protein